MHVSHRPPSPLAARSVVRAASPAAKPAAKPTAKTAQVAQPEAPSRDQVKAATRWGVTGLAAAGAGAAGYMAGYVTLMFSIMGGLAPLAALGMALPVGVGLLAAAGAGFGAHKLMGKLLDR